MSTAQLEHYSIANPKVAELLAGRNQPQAERLARYQLSEALCDWAGAQIIRKDVDAALLTLQDALNASPENRRAFHNLVGTLLSRRKLRGAQLLGILRFMSSHDHSLPWLQEYRGVAYLPMFINLEVVRGKCNLKCRMCLGTNSPNHPNRFDYMPAEEFRKTLAAAPSIQGVTLSSGDSDPLLHPQFGTLIEIAQEHEILLDLFTNGHPLSVRVARQMVESGVVQMINFSIDASTQETYSRIRGDDLSRLRGKIDMLASMKREFNRNLPWFSFSFVAMRDNIHELPDFVTMAHSHGAQRVFVEDLIGWDADPNGNIVATDHPRWREFVADARARASEYGIKLALPERFQHESRTAEVPPATTIGTGGPSKAGQAALWEPAIADAAERSASDENGDQAQTPRLSACSWLNGLMVGRSGRIDPCCLLQNAADMGTVYDGPLHLNAKYVHVKGLLASGAVFEGCVNQRMCQYVQQQHAAGVPLRIITREELGDCYIPAATACTSDAIAPEAAHALPVLASNPASGCVTAQPGRHARRRA